MAVWGKSRSWLSLLLHLLLYGVRAGLHKNWWDSRGGSRRRNVGLTNADVERLAFALSPWSLAVFFKSLIATIDFKALMKPNTPPRGKKSLLCTGSFIGRRSVSLSAASTLYHFPPFFSPYSSSHTNSIILLEANHVIFV